MPISRFRFKLKKVSAREQAVLDAVHSFLPATGLREGFARGVGEALATNLGEAFSFRLEAVSYETFSNFCSRLPQSAIVAAIGMVPATRKAMLEIDSHLASMAVERLLGGDGDGNPEPRPLSDTEQGVLEYLLLQVLAHVHRLCGRSARVDFRFEGFLFKQHEIKELSDAGDGVAVLVFRVSFGRRSGFVRLALPDPFVEQGMMDVEAPGEARPEERAWLKENLSRFGYVKVPLWAEAGRTTLDPGDLAGLEVGDVILLDRSTVSLAGKMPLGTVILRVGDGMSGGIEAEMEIEGSRARCTVAGFHMGE